MKRLLPVAWILSLTCLVGALAVPGTSRACTRSVAGSCCCQKRSLPCRCPGSFETEKARPDGVQPAAAEDAPAVAVLPRLPEPFAFVPDACAQFRLEPGWDPGNPAFVLPLRL